MHLHRSRQTYGCAFRIVNATLHIYNSKGMNVSCNGISVSANVTVGTPWCSSRDNRYDIACCCEGSCPTYVPYGFNDIFGGNTLARSFILKEEMFYCEGSCMHDVQSIIYTIFLVGTPVFIITLSFFIPCRLPFILKAEVREFELFSSK